MKTHTPILKFVSLLSLSFIMLASLPLKADIASQKDLKDQLFMKAKQGQHSMSYDEARRVIFGRLYLDRSDDNRLSLVDKYCNFTIKSPNVGVNEIPSNSLLNVEHIWPQSKFNNRLSPSYQKSDLHHLLPVDAKANSIRGNNSFGEVTDHRQITYGQCEASWFDRSRKIFEPADEIKGNIARAMFYFSIRYKSSIDPEEEEILRRWHHIDPVTDDDKEMHERIFRLQGNRNPFIDDPSLVDAIQDF